MLQIFGLIFKVGFEKALQTLRKQSYTAGAKTYTKQQGLLCATLIQRRSNSSSYVAYPLTIEIA